MQNEIIFICSTFTQKVTAQRKCRTSASGKSGQHTIFINMSRVFISYALRYDYGYSMTVARNILNFIHHTNLSGDVTAVQLRDVIWESQV
jgi:hypothetical protein